MPQLSKVEKTCSNPECGRTYEVARHRADGSRFCSVACTNTAKVVYPRRECAAEGCANLVRGRDTIYCSKACYIETQRGRVRARRSDAGTKKSEWVERPCACGCGVVVRRRKSEARQKMFASRECSARCPYKESRGQPVRTQIGFKRIVEGYVHVYVGRGAPGAYKSGYALEHRLVMEQVLGRPLLPSESAHHKNLNRADNRPENLELWTTRQPKGARVEDLVIYAKELLARYEPAALR